jgi:hypothetical protein
MPEYLPCRLSIVRTCALTDLVLTRVSAQRNLLPIQTLRRFAHLRTYFPGFSTLF